MTSAQSPFQKLNSGNSSQKTRQSRYQTLLFLPSFTVSLLSSEYLDPGCRLQSELEKIKKKREMEKQVEGTSIFIIR